MKYVRLGVAVTLAVATLSSLNSSAARAQDVPINLLRRGIDAIVEQEAFGNAIWGIEIRDAASGKVLYARNAHKSMLPASNTKLATTAAALEQLGPDFRLETTLFAEGEVADSTLRGRLIVRGGGDPTIAEGLRDYGYVGLFAEWADSLRAAGIAHVEGVIVGDDDAFDDVPYGPGWQWDDLPYYYAPQISALSYNENVARFSLLGQSPGRPAVVDWEPRTGYVTARNQTVSVHSSGRIEEEYVRDERHQTFILRSRVPEGQVEREALSVWNPTLFFVHVLREELERARIDVAGPVLDVDDLAMPPRYDLEHVRPIARHHSPPISRLVELVNRPSHNLAAESLHKTLGRIPASASEGWRVGTWSGGRARVAETLARAGVDTTTVDLRDGSGLSRMNVVTPKALAQLLTYMWNHDNPQVRDAFVASLAIGGAPGTLSARFTSGAPAQRVHARTGTMSFVSALSGYLTRPSDPPLVFVILCNNFTVPSRVVRAAQDDIVNLLARLTL